MKGTPKTDLGEQYEELTLLLSQLNTDAPKIQMLYKELRSNTDVQNKLTIQATTDLNELRELTLHAIQDERNSAIELFKQYARSAEKALTDAKELQTQLDAFSKLMETTNDNMKKVWLRLDQIESKVATLSLTPQGTRALNTVNKPQNKQVIKVDYDEVATAKELYDKYSGKIDGPIIVQKIGWHGDYAFVVDELYRNGTWVKGIAYLNGEFQRNASYHADRSEFRMYNGPSSAKIKKVHN